MEMLKASAGFRMTHIPYTGAGPAIVALLAGQIDAIASGPSTVVQQIQAGKLRALAHWGEQPLAALPGVPSLTQSGYPVRFAQWSALFVPSKTPDEVVQRCAPRPPGPPPTRPCARWSTRRAARSSTSMRPSSRPTGTPMRR